MFTIFKIISEEAKTIELSEVEDVDDDMPEWVEDYWEMDEELIIIMGLWQKYKEKRIALDNEVDEEEWIRQGYLEVKYKEEFLENMFWVTFSHKNKELPSDGYFALVQGFKVIFIPMDKLAEESTTENIANNFIFEEN